MNETCVDCIISIAVAYVEFKGYPKPEIKGPYHTKASLAFDSIFFPLYNGNR